MCNNDNCFPDFLSYAKIFTITFIYVNWMKLVNKNDDYIGC